MAKMSVQLVAVERRLWSGEANSVVAQTTEGEIGLLPGHEPLLGQLVEGGVVTISTDDETVTAAVHGGFLSVTGEGVSVLAESAELANEIDVAQAREDAKQDEDEQARARASSRLRAAGQSS